MTFGKNDHSALPGPDDIVRRQLDNGIAVLVRENQTSPAVVVSGYLQVGAIDVPSAQAGMATFTAAALMRGTRKRTFAQIYDEIEAVGGEVSFGSGVHTTGFGAKCLAEDLPLVLDVLAEAMRQPTFPEKEIERLRGQMLTALDMRANDTGAMAGLAFRELAYANGHPYGRSVRGYPDTIRALSRDDLVRFYQAGYGAQGLTMCIVGAVHAEEIISQVEVVFNDWRGCTFPRLPLPAVRRPEGIVSKRVDLPNKSQTDVIMGLPGPARAEPDFLDTSIANYILGMFGMMGRLGKHLRDEQGLAYFVYSHLEGGLGPGPWSISAGVDPAKVERIIESARVEIRRLRDTEVDAAELADVQTYLTGSLPLSLETNEGVAGAILNMTRHELGFDYLSRYPDLVNQVTPERIQAAARKWLDADNLAVGIAGSGATGSARDDFGTH